MKNKKLLIFILMILMLIGCGNTSSNDANASEGAVSAPNYIVVGFSQLGAESDWRAANTESMRETFSKENGYELIIEDGQQKQSNQITAIRSFIQQGVDYIVLAPVTETGWDTVLQEAKDAGIPVIIVDRMVDVENEDLFVCWVGSDFNLEGLKAAQWLHEYNVATWVKPEEINIVNIQGSLGSSAQLGRTRGLEVAAKKYGWNLLEEACGDFTQAKAREVMEELLRKHPDLNVVYCENDNEALGAIEAIESEGKKVGPDIRNGEIMILSFDGVNEEARNYALEGKISCITECNPLHGPRVRTIIEEIERGEIPEKFEYVDETIYSTFDEVRYIFLDEGKFPVTMLK